MARMIEFTKMHGAGNDYIYVNAMTYPIHHPERLSILLSDRHKGVGADGLVLIARSDVADFSMRIFNADGSEALMCGNASRCIGKYVYTRGLTRKQNITLDTLSGIKELKLLIEGSEVKEVCVDMGIPFVQNTKVRVEAGDRSFDGTVVSMGNPHFVVFLRSLEHVDLLRMGSLIENNPAFPSRTNVEFAEIINPSTIRMKVWERGSGLTMACGTGACATAVAGLSDRMLNLPVTIRMDGGSVMISMDERTKSILMSGDAIDVFDGKIEVDD